MVKMLLFSFLALSTSLNGDLIEKGMKELSLDERICMKVFFNEAILHGHAAHVLFFNNKPVSLTGPAIQHADRSYQDLLCLKGWRAFKRRQHLFPHPNFIFSEHLYDGGRECKVLDIYIINKPALEKCLGEYQAAFREVLGEDFSPGRFIANLEHGEPLPKLVCQDQMLMGILLGYGEESAREFKRVCGQPQMETYRRIDLKSPKGCIIQPVVFMGNPHSDEVRKLASMYEEELQTIWARYLNESPLKLFLRGICQQ
ncbi:MAG: hypothetical protein JJU12_08620 [Chlamydiales bacterium]|nr:hypothetical protein [Chlamydiales bacterium]